MIITIDLSKDSETLLLDIFKYQVEVSDGKGGTIPNPESEQEFLTRKIEDIVKNQIKEDMINIYVQDTYDREIDL